MPFLLLKAGDPLGLWVAPLTPARSGEPSRCAAVAGPPPRHDVAGVQAATTVDIDTDDDPEQIRQQLREARRVIAERRRATTATD